MRSMSGTGIVKPAEHQPRRHLLRALVDRAGREDVRRASALRTRRGRTASRRGCGRSGCPGRRRRRRGRGARSRPGARRRPPPRPRPRSPRRARRRAADQRPAQPVGVLVQLLERRALRADEAVAEHVVAVAADAGDLLAAVRRRRSVISRPQPASHSGQVRNAVRVARSSRGASVAAAVRSPRSSCDAATVRQLLPEPIGRRRRRRRLRRRRARPALPDRPWVLVNMIASVDGATAVDGRSGALGGDADNGVFHALRPSPTSSSSAPARPEPRTTARPSRDRASRRHAVAVVTASRWPRPVAPPVRRGRPGDPSDRHHRRPSARPTAVAALEASGRGRRSPGRRSSTSASPSGPSASRARRSSSARAARRSTVSSWRRRPRRRVVPDPGPDARRRHLVAGRGRRPARRTSAADAASTGCSRRTASASRATCGRSGHRHGDRFDSSVTSRAKSAGSSKPL